MAAPRPMKATTGPLPAGPTWVYELKWDGMRAIVECVDGDVRLWSANGKDATAAYPDLVGVLTALTPLDVVLDGEIVALDEAGHPSFERLQHRMHVTSPVEARARAAEVPIAIVLFDVLQVGDHDTTALPWRDRRALLESLVDERPLGVELTQVYDDGTDLLEAARVEGLEGVIAKRSDAAYAVGRRSPSWVKVKARRRQEMVVGGWADGQGNREGHLGALLVGHHETVGDSKLRYAGRVGTGYTVQVLAQLRDLLAPLAVDECPFDPPPPRDRSRDAHWVRPDLVVEVEFGNWTSEGILRHPVYLGLRSDKDPAEVIREP